MRGPQEIIRPGAPEHAEVERRASNVEVRPSTLDSRHSTALDGLQAIPARLLLAAIWLYRHTLSPALPAVFGPTCGCRFHPTCAVYAADAVRVHGAWRGAGLSLRRLLRCHPFHPGGFDPVPPAATRAQAGARPRPVARRTAGRTRTVAPAASR